MHDRYHRACQALDAFAPPGSSLEEAIVDLITDLLLYADHRRDEFSVLPDEHAGDLVMARAELHYLSER